MPFSPYERDPATGVSGDREPEQWRDPAAGPDMRTSARDDREEARAEEPLEEPGYGHGV